MFMIHRAWLWNYATTNHGYWCQSHHAWLCLWLTTNHAWLRLVHDGIEFWFILMVTMKCQRWWIKVFNRGRFVLWLISLHESAAQLHNGQWVWGIWSKGLNRIWSHAKLQSSGFLESNVFYSPLLLIIRSSHLYIYIYISTYICMRKVYTCIFKTLHIQFKLYIIHDNIYTYT